MTKSMMLLNEAIFELHELAIEAKAKNSLIYEGMGYTPFQVVLLEAEAEADSGGDKKDTGFLKRTGAAIKKLRQAGQAAQKELEDLNKKVGGVMPTTGAAIGRALKDLKGTIPGKGLMGAISGGGMAVKALFGSEDDPAEKVAGIVADANAFQKLLTTVLKTVNQKLNLDDENLAKVVQKLGSEDPDQDLADLKELISSAEDTKLVDLLTDEKFDKFWGALDFNESSIEDAIKDSIKPAEGMFSGLRSLGSTLGIGLGGDVPFKKYYGMGSGKALKNDVLAMSLADIKSITGKLPQENTDDAEALAQGLKGLAGAKEQAPPEVLAPSSPGGKPTAQAPGTPGGSDGTNKPASPKPGSMGAKIDKVLNGAGFINPAGARKVFADLVGVELAEARQFSLYDLLQEKAVRYDDVVEKLKDFLPGSEDEWPQAIEKLSDEMKVELGSEFQIVGVPDVGATEREQLRMEIEAIKSALEDIQDPDARERAQQQVRDALADQNVDAQTVDAIVDTSVSTEDAVSTTGEQDNSDEVVAALPAPDQAVDLVTGADEAANELSDDILKPLESVLGFAGPAGKKAFDAVKETIDDLDPATAKELWDLVKVAAAAKGDEKKSKALEVVKWLSAKALKGQAEKILPANLANAIFGDSKDGDSKDDKKSPKKGEYWLTTSKKVKKPAPVKIMSDPKKGKAKVAWLSNLKSQFSKDIRDLTDGPISEKEATKLKQEAVARIAVAKMRGWLLNEIQDFKRVSYLAHKDVIFEFYSRGGTNELIRETMKRKTTQPRWTLLAGLRNE